MTRSAEEIERDVEATRGDLDRTVEALKEKMTPKNIASEMMDTIRNSPVARQAQDNAVPLALMGAGLAWMLFNRRRSDETRNFAEFQSDYEGAPESGYLGGEEERTGALRQKVKDATASARETLSSTASTAAERARMVAGSARQQAVRYGERAQETFMDTLDREPLIIGALGIAVGAAVGAALPSTPIEDRYVGPLRDRALDEGKTRAKAGFRQAKEVASAAVDTVKQEAQAQGFTDVKGLADKVEQVARAGVESVKREVETRRGH